MKKLKKLISIVLLIFFIVSCQATIPKNALMFDKQTLNERQMQSRKYETTDEMKILSSCVSLLQDMGFNIDETEVKLGVITSSKMRDATNAGQIATAVIVAVLFGGGVGATDKEQKMRACIVTNRSLEDDRYVVVRVTFQRIIWNTKGQITTSESLKDPTMYQEFFSKLSKSIFLEAHSI